MKQRVVVVILALVLALAGGATLLAYVKAADRRAMAGMASTEVLVVVAPVARGTAAADLAEAVQARTLPAVAVASSAVTDLASLQGQVTTADLVPGEQLLSSRFADPATLGAPPELPAGQQDLTLRLDRPRAVGGDLRAGDHVAVFLSTDIKDNPLTHLSVSGVLVRAVVGGTSDPAQPGAAPAGDATAEQAAPAETVTVTLAVTNPQAERIVFAAEHGTVWLSRQGAERNADGTTVISQGNLYR